MARLYSCGFELNSSTAGVEITSSIGTISVVTSPVRSGTYSLRTNPTSPAQGYITYQFAATDQTASFFYRCYIYIATLPSSQTPILSVVDSSGFHVPIFLLQTNGTIQLGDENYDPLGSPSSALSTDTWYRLELNVDTTTLSSTTYNAKINGTSFASGTYNPSGYLTGQRTLRIGVEGVNTTDLYFDDIAINDSTGSFQNSWPGAGEIIHLKPDSVGDNSDWTNDYTSVDEVTPDDATSFCASATAEQIDDHNLDATPDALASNDVINCVQVGVRFNGEGASANSSFVLRIKEATGETVEESSAITPSNTTWVTNAASAPRNYSLTLYNLPNSSTKVWTKGLLDTAQIGCRLSTANTNDAQISTLWLLVDHTESSTSKISRLRKAHLFIK